MKRFQKQMRANEKTLQSLCLAIQQDLTTIPSIDSYSDAINASLVLCGARSGARLDNGNYKGDSAFITLLLKLAKKSKHIVVVKGSEPIIADMTKCSKADIDMINKEGSDLQPDISAAMGRIFGYRCKYEKSSWQQNGHISLEVLIRVFGCDQMHHQQLAAFGCGPSVSVKEMRAKVLDAYKYWVASNCHALAGAVVDVKGFSFAVVGFDVIYEECQSSMSVCRDSLKAKLIRKYKSRTW